MTKTREKELWKWLSKASKAAGPDLHMERIENSLSAGTPDVELCYKGRTAWIELKTAERPVRDGTPVRFPTRPEQVEWMNTRGKAGGACYWLLLISPSYRWKEGVGSIVHPREILLLPYWEGVAIHGGLTMKGLRDVAILRDEKPLTIVQSVCGNE